MTRPLRIPGNVTINGRRYFIDKDGAVYDVTKASVPINIIIVEGRCFDLRPLAPIPDRLIVGAAKAANGWDFPELTKKKHTGTGDIDIFDGKCNYLFIRKDGKPTMAIRRGAKCVMAMESVCIEKESCLAVEDSGPYPVVVLMEFIMYIRN